MKLIALLLLTAAVAHGTVTVTRTSNDGRHPSSIEIEVKLPNDKAVRIPLTRTDDFENIPMTVLDNGLSTTFSSSQVHHDSHAHYRDIASKSVISVREVNGKRQISGHVMHEGTSYFLEPIGDSEHRVTMNTANPELMAKQIDIERLDIQSRKKRQTNRSPTTYIVELHLLIDDTVWSQMRSIFGDANALTEMHYYYTHILNGIDTSYRNIGTLSISVKCIGITIAKSAYDSRWMPSSLDGSAILSSLTSYITGKTADHFMAFTRKDITGGGSSSVCGMAYVSGACTARRVSINEDQGLHSWGTAAHELGHNLGSPHDGSGNSCNPGSKNLMSPSTQIYSLSDVHNSYRFSSCTVNSISTYVNSLGSSNCLKSTDGSQVPELSQDVREGARLTLDQVCKLTFPNSMGKMMVTNNIASNPGEICASIYCQMTSTSGNTGGGLRAPVGTPCGSQKSCNWNGQCTTDSQVPVMNMACFWGDAASAAQCQNYYQTISGAPNAATRSYYCGQVKSACCKTLASICA